MPSVTVAPLSGRYLSFAEREEIALLRAQKLGVREIARRIGRSPSTISRELRRNAGTHSGSLTYRASTAQWHADRRGRRPKPVKLATKPELRRYVQDRLSGAVQRPDGRAVAGPEVWWIGRRHGPRKDRRWGKSWSPEQISNRLRLDFPDDESMRVSHEAIYQSLYVQGRGALRQELTACLRTGRALRVPRARARRGKSFVTDQVLISERPAEALHRRECVLEDRTRSRRKPATIARPAFAVAGNSPFPATPYEPLRTPLAQDSSQTKWALRSARLRTEASSARPARSPTARRRRPRSRPLRSPRQRRCTRAGAPGASCGPSGKPGCAD
jgi:Helix-turn-helix domain